MFVEWLEPKIQKIEIASDAVLKNLSIDDPNRPNKTEYNYPREEYVASCIHYTQRALRSVLLSCRLIRSHHDRPKSELLTIDVATLIDQQQMWQRKLSEILCNLINLQKLGKDYFKLKLLQDKAEGRKTLSGEMRKIYGSKLRLLEVYCSNDQVAFDALKKSLSNSSITSWNAETIIEKAFETATDDEKYVLGHYLNYRIRCGAIHFSTFPKENSKHVDVDLLLFHLMITTFLAQYIVARSAQMFADIPSEVAAISDEDMKKIFAEHFKSQMDPNVLVGDKVSVRYDGKRHLGIVEEIRTGSLGGKSYKVASLPGEVHWGQPNDFHAAVDVEKIAT